MKAFQIDILRPRLLPRVALSEKDELPDTYGLYFVFQGETLLYVGKTERSFRKRWLCHHKMPDLERLEDIEIAFWETLSTGDDLTELETLAIKKFCPPMNSARVLLTPQGLVLRRKKNTKPPQQPVLPRSVVIPQQLMQPAITPQQFMDKWKLTRSELAELLGASLDTVNHWFSHSTREPATIKLQILAMIDSAWTIRRYQELRLDPKFFEIYERAKRRESD